MNKKIIVLVLLATFGYLFSPEVNYAEEGAPEVDTGTKKEEGTVSTKEEEEKGAVADLVNFIKSIHPGFYIDTSYEYNFNRPESMTNQLRVFDTEANSFTINLFQLSFLRTPTIEGGLLDLVGFGVKLDFGEDAQVLSTADDLDPNSAFNLQEAYINILAPIGNGLNIIGGKFVTLAGAEVIESKDDFNYSRSFLFGFAIPFTHTGVRFHYPVAPFDFTVGLVNGWDVVKDNNEPKTIETKVGLAVEKFSIGVVGYFGPEEDDATWSQWRELVDIVATLTPIEKLTLVVNADFGWQQDVNMVDSVTDEQFEENVFWWGVAGYIAYDFSDIIRFALRGEYFDDPDGFRTGTPQKLWELTPTLQLRPLAGHTPFDNLLFRLEYRHDQSDENVFEDHDGDFTKKTQDTVALELLYYFTL